jgi:hypothetical protein
MLIGWMDVDMTGSRNCLLILVSLNELITILLCTY